MAFWNRNADKPTDPPDTPAPPPALPEVEELAELMPQRDPEDGEYLWQPYVERIIKRLDGLPAPQSSGKPFVRACLAEGCKAVPVMEENVMWRNKMPDRWDREARAVFEARVRLALFFAMSLRYLAHTLCRLRIKMGRVEDWHVFKDGLQAGDACWQPLFGGGVSFRELEEASDAKIDITWLDAQPTQAQVSTLAPCFLKVYEQSLVTLDLAVDVMACVEPGAPGGMFGSMLYFTGHIDRQRPDVPRIFLQALRRAAWSRRLRLGSNPGDLFITPEVSFLTAPTAVDLLLGLIRKRGHSFTRPDIYRGLGDAGCLVGIRPGAKRHTRVARLKAPDWRAAIRVRGLAIANNALWDVQMPPGYFDGTVTIQE